MIDCTEAVRQLWDYVQGEIEPVERETVEEHLALCRRCCGEMEFAEEMRGFMMRLPTVEMPPDLRQRFEVLIDELEGDGVP